MLRRLTLLTLSAAVLAISACGDGDDSPITSESNSPASAFEGPAEDVEVIRDWSEALTESNLDGAAEFFALPSRAENGLNYEIETREDAVLFNGTLPCGATLESTSAEGRFITATFELTERPGAGPCPGSGNLAQTSFVIEDGAIVDWRRVALPGERSGGQTA